MGLFFHSVMELRKAELEGGFETHIASYMGLVGSMGM